MSDVVRPDRPSSADWYAERFCCLSHHGTVLCADRADGRLVTRRIGQVSPAEDLHVVATDAGGVPSLSVADAGDRPAGLAGDTVVGVQARSPLKRHLVSLKRGRAYITADNDGTVRNDAHDVRAWEVFMLVRAGEMAALDAFLSTDGYFTDRDGTARDIRRCGMGSNYVLHLAERRIDLSAAADLVAVLRGLSLMDSPEGEPIVPGPSRMRLASPPRIHVTHLGNMANRVLQYLVAENLRSRVEGAVIGGVDIPEWSLLSPAPTSPDRVFVDIGWNKVDLDLPGLADCLSRRAVDTVHLRGYPFDVILYPPLDRCRALLPPLLPNRQAVGFGPSELVCSVRGGDILHGIHGGYLALPPRYYRLLQERSGLDLVFFGQIEDSPYSNLLRLQFPEARFISGQSPQHDFEVLRRSRHVAISISTFSWLAAWLGEAESVYLPIAGIFNPVQYRTEFHLPLGDMRYRYTLFPYAKMLNVYADPRAFHALLGFMEDFMKPVSAFDVEQLCQRASRFRRSRPPLKGFDNGHYLSTYPDVAASFYEGRLASPLQHYLDIGCLYDLAPRPFDEAGYLKRRPEAAMAVAEGHFASLLHHAMA